MPSNTLISNGNFSAAGRLHLQLLHAMVSVAFAFRSTIAQQSNYEKSVFSKTSRTNARGEGTHFAVLLMLLTLYTVTLYSCVAAEVTMFDEVVVCYKFIGDLMFYVTGSQDENELILHTVLVAFYESVTLLLRYTGVLEERLH